MKQRFFRITIWLSVITLLVGVGGGMKLIGNDRTVRAVGDLTVNWGVPEGSPIFVINNMAPGQTEVRHVDVVNNASATRPVGVRGKKTSEAGNLSNVLEITISSAGTDLYGGSTGTKTLAQFFSESSGIDGITLLNVNPAETKTIDFTVVFQTTAGNEFQETSVIFDLTIGIAIKVPHECLSITFSGDPIFGTQNNDRIRGTNGNDLIFGLEGDDNIDGGNGNDCVVGGFGNDRISTSNGLDMIFGNEGNDTLSGSNARDQIFGGPGNDVITGSNGIDTIEGNEGNDKIDAGNGDDQVFGGLGNDAIEGSNGDDKLSGGEGNDKINGGNGNDQVLGESGNDTMIGGNGNDKLIGGPDSDSANGNLGMDTCDAETETSCEL